MTAAAPPAATERVLPTLNVDGTRRWLRPRLSRGRWLRRRFALGWALILVFVALPHLRVGGKPAILLDVVAREFTLAGRTFLATDGLLLMLAMIGILATVLFATAVVGRAWCGWACPQTVYMELLFRPLERLVEGPVSQQRRKDRPLRRARRVLKLAAYLAIAAFLGNTFLAYFVSWDALMTWVLQSPLRHPAPFLVMLVTTALVMADFAWFREQTCLVACPYGRFQSVLLDKDSLIVGYDARRGEPRRMPARRGEGEQGDCIDCSACVATCPTGIDIHDGLQMECVGCTQCIDACDAIMDRVFRARGLVRYTTQAGLLGSRGRLLRPRVAAYAAIALLAFSGLAWRTVTAPSADVTILRRTSAPYALMDDGRVSNFLRVKIVNRSASRRAFRLDVQADGTTLQAPGNPATLEPGQAAIVTGFVLAPRGSFARGERDAVVTVRDGERVVFSSPYALLGP